MNHHEPPDEGKSPPLTDSSNDLCPQEALEAVLGYLNFSSGNATPAFLRRLDTLYDQLRDSDDETPTWRLVLAQLNEALEELCSSSAAFSDCTQAHAVLRLLTPTIESYLAFHRDLLFHMNEQTCVRPFFLGRVCEAILLEGAPWDEEERIVEQTIVRLNDFIGHRPVATLEQHKHEPYANEWVRPIPLWVRGAGAATGPYQEVIEAAIKLISATSESILRQAHFDPEMLDELAVNPRAFDFDHPVNKRPNYHFGQWDPHHIDRKGNYRRFVVQQVTIEALMTRLDTDTTLKRSEVITEAAAVLAGTMLMASGISGSGPGTYDSTVTLGNLVPRIASYRDEFYEELITRIESEHSARLREEAKRLRQPFGAARQALNAQIARRRATQLERVMLARLFARMGYPEAAQQQADIVLVASARMRCRIDCLLTTGHRAVAEGRADEAVDQLRKVMELLHRGIECGAIVDPWNVLGFDAHFSLFPSPESSVHDHRIDELLEQVEQVFSLYARVWREAAATDDVALCEAMTNEFRDATQWWNKFAVHEVSSVAAANANGVYQAGENVSRALGLWNKAGAAAGDVAFWAPHAEMFDSPKAYALVVEALLDRGDRIASLALLIHWLSQAPRVELEQGETSFYRLFVRWQTQHLDTLQNEDENSADAWRTVGKTFDYLEANADEYWEVPDFLLKSNRQSRKDERPDNNGDELFDEEDEESNLFGAAYEDVVYRDTTDDGVEGNIFDTSSDSAGELEEEAMRISSRLAFLGCLARMWKSAAVAVAKADPPPADMNTRLRAWFQRADVNRRQLAELLDDVANYRISDPSGTQESLIEYDRSRSAKDGLLERIIDTSVEMAGAGRYLLANAQAAERHLDNEPLPLPVDLDDDQQQAIRLCAAMFQNDSESAREQFPIFVECLQDKPLLYVPLGKGGKPRQIISSQVRQQTLEDLLAWMPRLGLLCETRQLLENARVLEETNPVGANAVTGYDALYEIGYEAAVTTLVQAAGPPDDDCSTDEALIGNLEQLTQSMIEIWLAHSRRVRLSVLEAVSDKKRWNELVEFIKKYGKDLFSKRFLNYANLRAILHQGVDTWINRLQDLAETEPVPKLIEDLDSGIERSHAVRCLSVILESTVENYDEYIDYHATTTQSDRGDMLYMLLDFLRLRISYDRIVWNLRPVVLAHKILIRYQRTHAAELWRRALAERFDDEANRFTKRLTKLQTEYAIRMPTIADRLGERFVQPMTIDRICALVEPAMGDAKAGRDSTSFKLLAKEIDTLAQDPSGVGLEAPAWLIALEDEIERAQRPFHERNDLEVFREAVAGTPLTLEEIESQIEDWLAEDDEDE